jgi:very-short-patch-repair endonuclease
VCFASPGRIRALASERWPVAWHAGGGLLSHNTGGALLRLEGLTAGELVHVMVEHGRRRSLVGVRLHRTIEVAALDRIVVDDLPVTSGTRTVLDLASVLTAEQLEVAFESARRRGLTSVDALRRRFEQFGGTGRTGSAKVRALLEAAGARPAESTLEVKVHRLLRQISIPQPELQVWVQLPDGRRCRLDFAWPDLLVAVECDGFEWHGDRLAWKRDRRRIAALEAAKWHLVHVTWEDVTKRRAETVERVRVALARPLVGS